MYFSVTPSFTPGRPIIRHCDTKCKDLYLYMVASADDAVQWKVLKVLKVL